MEITAHMAGTIYLVNVRAGDRVQPGDEAIILESMKMEMPVPVLVGGTIRELRVQPGDVVQEGDVLAVLEAEA